MGQTGRRVLAINKKVKNIKMLLANLQLHVVVNAPIDFIRKYEYDRGKSENLYTVLLPENLRAHLQLSV